MILDWIFHSLLYSRPLIIKWVGESIDGRIKLPWGCFASSSSWWISQLNALRMVVVSNNSRREGTRVKVSNSHQPRIVLIDPIVVARISWNSKPLTQDVKQGVTCRQAAERVIFVCVCLLNWSNESPPHKLIKYPHTPRFPLIEPRRLLNWCPLRSIDIRGNHSPSLTLDL